MSIRNWAAFVVVGVGLVVACGGSSGNPLTSAQSSVLCGPTVDCGSRKCDPNLGCVDCAADTDCGGANKLCVLGTCVACKTNTDCGAANPACWPGYYQCHASCSGDAGAFNGCIPGIVPVCDKTTGACEGCAQNSDCSSQAPFCNATFRACVECAADKDCPTSAPRCMVTGQCQQCLSNADCTGSTPVCDGATLKCRAGCSADADCNGTSNNTGGNGNGNGNGVNGGNGGGIGIGNSSTPKCNTTTRTCVACLSTTDCPTSAKLCSVAGRCVACESNKDCSGTTPICSDQGVCVACQNTSDCPSGQACLGQLCR